MPISSRTSRNTAASSAAGWATKLEHQLIVVYCREDALYNDAARMAQFLKGITRLPIPLGPEALVVSDNADIYGTLEDLRSGWRTWRTGDHFGSPSDC